MPDIENNRNILEYFSKQILLSKIQNILIIQYIPDGGHSSEWVLYPIADRFVWLAQRPKINGAPNEELLSYVALFFWSYKW